MLVHDIFTLRKNEMVRVEMDIISDRGETLIDFRCICGKEVQYFDLFGEIVECDFCHRKYRVTTDVKVELVENGGN